MNSAKQIKQSGLTNISDKMEPQKDYSQKCKILRFHQTLAAYKCAHSFVFRSPGTEVNQQLR